MKDLKERNGNMNADKSLELTHPVDISRIEQVNLSATYNLSSYTVGSKSEDGDGSGIEIFHNNELTHQLKFKINTNCSDNRTELFAILKALQLVQHHKHVRLKSATMSSDGKITLGFLKNNKNHSTLTEQIRHYLKLLIDGNWTTAYTWIKTHAGIIGKDMAGNLAERAKTSQHYTTKYLRVNSSQL